MCTHNWQQKKGKSQVSFHIDLNVVTLRVPVDHAEERSKHLLTTISPGQYTSIFYGNLLRLLSALVRAVVSQYPPVCNQRRVYVREGGIAETSQKVTTKRTANRCYSTSNHCNPFVTCQCSFLVLTALNRLRIYIPIPRYNPHRSSDS